MQDTPQDAHLAAPDGMARAEPDDINWGLGDPCKDLRGEVLDLLNKERVFAIQRGEDGAFCFYERCDEYFRKPLTREQVLKLADELRALALEPVQSQP